MFIQFLELVTIIGGIIAAVAAMTVAVFFFRTNSRIGRAVGIDKMAECINMAVIVAFAMFYYLDILALMPIVLAIILRLISISATMFSSINLARETRYLQELEKDRILPGE